MSLLAAVVGAVLLALAALHALWATGASWPAPDRRTLSATVGGHPLLQDMPGQGITAVVAGALFVAVWIVMAGGGLAPWPLPDALLRVALAGVTAVFLARGSVTYLNGGPWRAEVQPFTRLDRQIFAPLCLALGCGVGLILVAHWARL